MNIKRHHVLYGILALSLILALIVFTIPSASGVSYTAPAGPAMSVTASLSIQAMHFDVATTTIDQQRGLGGRADVPENYGLLFVFQNEARVGFWMKDMLVPIDILWLSDKGTILGIEDSLQPSTYPQIYYPPSSVKYVLEIRAGEARRRGWKIGTSVELPLPYGK